MKDFVDKELAVGDDIVFMRKAEFSSHFRRGTVVGFSEKRVRVRHKNFMPNGPEFRESSLAPHNIVKV